jgi:hypothetical protein
MPGDGLNHYFARVATGDGGIWGVVWEAREFVTPFQDTDVLSAQSTDGVTWTAPAAIKTTVTYDIGADSTPDLGTDLAGTWLAAWFAFDPQFTVADPNETEILRATTAKCEGVRHCSCHRVRLLAGLEPSTTVSLVDRFGSTTPLVRRALALCAPASKNDEDPDAPADGEHLEAYRLLGTPLSPAPTLTFGDQFGVHVLTVSKPSHLLVPTLKRLTPPGPQPPVAPYVDHFQCYKIQVVQGALPTLAGVHVADQFGATVAQVRTAKHLCVPADKNGENPGAELHPDALLCYATASDMAPVDVLTNNQFGAQQLRVRRARLLCVPARERP